ncbi:MAG: acetolactate synthase large subunit [Proteobacteria bacterium]|nr:acetolactate synthase large subunit [Pseudomonadota bacterium]
MNGAESLLQTLVECGVEVCFTNPGTSEMHFVAALDKQDGMRSVLGLFEGVVTGAADGYARMTGKPACTLLHLGPGLANGLANLHNARRARVPLVNIVGDHATYHRHLDAPLTSNIAGFAEPVSGWIRASESSESVAADGAAAVAAAMTPPGQIATLILPADTAWGPAAGPARPVAAPARRAPDGAAVDAAAAALRSGERCALLMNGAALSERGLELAGRIAQKTGAQLFADTFVTRIARGAGRVDVQRVPYFGEQAAEVLAPYRHLILVATKAPVTFFAYPGKPSELTPVGCTTHVLSTPEQDALAALDALCEAVSARSSTPAIQTAQKLTLPRGALTAQSAAQTLGCLFPDGAIIVNESATSGFAIPSLTAAAAPHDWLDLTGGAIGQGLPTAVGAAVACPGRRVLALEGDGAGMYTLQALWTMAREGLDVTTVIFANRKYAILQVELLRVGAGNPGRKAEDMLSLSRPDLDWVKLANGMGVPATRATTAEEFNNQLARSLAAPGPGLIEVVL